jgi:hypothetical protein
MKSRILAAALGLAAAATPAFSATYNLGLLDITKPLYHAFTDFTGSFTDIYTFTLPSSTDGVAGDTTTINFGDLWNVQLSGATLTGSGIGSLSDTNPNDGFSFSGLTGGGSYSLAISGKVDGSGLAGVTGIYGGYVSAVPEPEAIALALVGLLATGAALRRRS